MSAAQNRLLEAGAAVLVKEGVLLDERRWDEWLSIYCADCVYWAPAWVDHSTLGADPTESLSHFYFESRAALAERVARITGGQSSASSPLPRTTHLIGSILPTAPPSPESMHLRCSWHCSVFHPRDNSTALFFGHAYVELQQRDSTWLIRKKKVVLQNDYIPTMLDFYCL